MLAKDSTDLPMVTSDPGGVVWVCAAVADPADADVGFECVIIAEFVATLSLGTGS